MIRLAIDVRSVGYVPRGKTAAPAVRGFRPAVVSTLLRRVSLRVIQVTKARQRISTSSFQRT